MTLENIIVEIKKELNRAESKFQPFASRHEGYAVILEELDELWNGVKNNAGNEYVKKEAIQVAAMAIRFVKDCCQ